MQRFISKLSIRTRIFSGYILIAFFIVAISVISYQGIVKTSHGFSSYVSINEQTEYILSIDNSISNLQRDVQDYIYTGYEAIAEKVLSELVDLETGLISRDTDFKEDEKASEYLNRMKDHLINYHRAFEFSAEERRKRQRYVSELNELKIILRDSKELPVSVEIVLVESENILFGYMEDPDIKKINNEINKLDENIKYIDSGSRKETFLQYRAKYIEVVQSTRGFLYLLSVVMAGEAQEFRYTSEKLKSLILTRNEPIKTLFREQIQETRNIIFNSSIILFLLAMVFSLSISKSISRPLHMLTETFNKLAEDKIVDSIPGQEYEDEIGQMSRAAEVFRKKNDDTKQLLITLDEKKNALEQSNVELQRFAYVASHDLQEPLRMVSSFTQLLAKRYKDKLDEDANEYIEFAVDGAKRMQSLIQDLLLFSKVETMGGAFEETDSNDLFDYAVENLKISIDETNSKVTRDELPKVFGDETQLKQLFQNLLGNALKYHEPKRINTVHCSVKESDTHWMFSIEDTGIGIEKDYFEKIFVIFQRLHTKHEYAGTGIGLALCKKIIDRHGGDIWLESTYGQGSTFFFSIDKKKYDVANHIHVITP